MMMMMMLAPLLLVTMMMLPQLVVEVAVGEGHGAGGVQKGCTCVSCSGQVGAPLAKLEMVAWGHTFAVVALLRALESDGGTLRPICPDNAPVPHKVSVD